MGYWNEVKEMVIKGLNIAADGIKEGAETAAVKGRDGVTYVQLKKDLFMEHRKLQDLLSDLGDRTHDLYKDKKDIYGDEKVKEIMDKVVDAEEKCKKIKEEIEQIGKEETAEKEEAKPEE